MSAWPKSRAAQWRVLLAIAREGIDIHGVENSGPMLGILNENLRHESPALGARVNPHTDDMRTFRLDRKFPLVTIPFRPMQHMFTVADQVAALMSAPAHVAVGGLLAFDVYYPQFRHAYAQPR